ncbi:MAG: hypothetical protein Aurels2KO_08700 [Aureliella sp.]
MRLNRSSFLSTALAFCCTVAGTLSIAQEPVAIVSISNLDRLKKDVSYMLEATNFQSVAPMVDFFGGYYTKGIDGSRPIGVSVTLNGQQPSALIFVPVTDAEALFGVLEEASVQVDELETGLWELITPGPALFAKKSGDWLFMAQTEEELAGDLPQAPHEQLGTLPNKYDLAIRLNVQALPEEMKNMAKENLRAGFESNMQAQTDQTEEERELAEQVGRAQLEQIERLMTETDKVFIGWSIESAKKVTYIDVGATVVPGTMLAENAALAMKATTDYSAFILPSASAKFRFTQQIPESERETTTQNMDNSLRQAGVMIDKSNDIPDGVKPAIKGVVDSLGALLKDTINEGKLDGAGSASVAGGKLRLLIGGRISDGNALAAEVQKRAKEIEGMANAPKFEFGYAEHGGVTLHRVTATVADPKAQQVVGGEAVLTVGTADKGFIIALDSEGDALVKQAIDKMQSNLDKSAQPFESAIKVGDILSFIQSISPNSMLDNAVQQIESYAENDLVQVNGRAIENGGIYRLSIDEGVLKAVGSAAQGGGGGGF